MGTDHHFVVGLGVQGSSTSYTSSISTADHQGFLGGYESSSPYFNFAATGMGQQGVGFANDWWLGGPVTAVAPHDISLNITSSNGTDKHGVNFTMNASRGSGTGTPGKFIWTTSDVLTTGSTLQTSTVKMVLNGDGNLTVGTSAFTPAAKLHVRGSGTTTGVNLLTEASDGTDRFAVEDNGEVLFSNQGGTSGQVLKSGGSNTPPTWSSDIAGVSRIINSSVTTAGNVGTGEDVIFTYTVPAGQLTSDKDQIIATFTGRLAGSANNKNIKIKFGSTTLYESTSVADASGSDWSAEVQIYRTGATTQKAIVRFTSNNTAINTLQRCTYSTPAETLSGTVVLSVTGEATANDEVLFHMGDVSYRPHE